MLVSNLMKHAHDRHFETVSGVRIRSSKHKYNNKLSVPPSHLVEARII